MPEIEPIDYIALKKRREELVDKVLQDFPNKKDGHVVLFGAFEKDTENFAQESSFYYLTGIIEPATALAIDCSSRKTILFVPNFGKEREKWMASTLGTDDDPSLFGVDEIRYMGSPCRGYQSHPFFERDQYANLIEYVDQAAQKRQAVFTLNPKCSFSYVEQRFVLQRLVNMIPHLESSLIDISAIVAHMRRIKSQDELELIYKAIEITTNAHAAVAERFEVGKPEFEMQAIIEYVFTGSGGSTAFPSIVASGKNSTILHYMNNNKDLEKNDLVLVDIGARYNYYCADLTRTYPLSGKFTDRQKEIYMMVLETQDYIANMAKPGLWLSNKNEPEKSLHHCALEFLKKKGYDKYFTHGIGHFLGIDVHDVGDYTKPLEAGDVITIEPGIYIKDESIGVRIEDNYWIVPDGAVCLSDELPKKLNEVEEMVQSSQE